MATDFLEAFLKFQDQAPLCEHLQDNFLATFQAANLTNIGVSSAEVHSENQHWYKIIIPVICVIGLVGNVLNLIILTRRRLLSRMDVLEKSATYGLVALAFSDMMFCLAVLPHSFMDVDLLAATNNEVYQLYYRLYGVGCINLFLMTSTWLIVYMAISRYIVVVYPFQARWTLGTRRAVISIMLVGVFSIFCTLPFFVHLRVHPCTALDQQLMYEYQSLWETHVETMLQLYMRWVWPILADFIPLGILSCLNWRLIRELRTATARRRRTCRGQVLHDSSQRVTLTLVVIVLMLFLFVSPSEILRYFNPYKSMGEIGHAISIVTNICQTINFAFNFVLYCVVSESFRNTARNLVVCCVHAKGHGNSESYSLTTVYSMRRTSIVVDHRYKESKYVTFV